MNSLQKLILFLFIFLASVPSYAQVSVATDMSLLRNNSPKQRFWTVGQTVHVQVHASKKESLYAWLSYYLNGYFNTPITGTAKDAAITPVTVSRQLNATWRYRHLSIGWKHYFMGSFNNEATWNIYGYGGFGLLLTKVSNSLDQSIDTTYYRVPVTVTNGKFNKLTFDLGVGTEKPIGTDVYLFSEIKALLPASDYPSPLLVQNNKVPFATSLNAGIRILIQ